MVSSVADIRADFDRIALLSEQHGHGDHHYHAHLLRQLPTSCKNALDIGCGAGSFTRLLAHRSAEVLAIDLSTEMLRLAREHSAASNIDYLLADIMTVELPAEGFDCIVSIATLHHLPLPQSVIRIKELLRPGGTLVLQDLTSSEGVVDRFRELLAAGVSVALRFWRTGRPLPPRQLRQAWSEHGRNESYLTRTQLQQLREDHFPAAQVRRHLLWRYTLVWQKPL